MSGRKAKALRREGLDKKRTTTVRLKLPAERWTKGLAAAGLMTGVLAPTPSLAFIQTITDVNGHSTNVINGNTQTITSDNSRFIGTTASANINGGEYVKWYQPSAGSIALLKVAGDSPSIWNGSFWSNGQFFLQNPSGVLFGSASRVDVASLTATTLNISNQDFLSGNYRFSQMAGYANAAVVNQGVITAGPGGYVALLGAAVRNEGVIIANAGSIALAAGKAATLDMRGDGLIEFVVTDAVSGSVAGPNGESLASYVSNTGTLQADGGMVTLTANAATDIIKSVVNNEGVIRAQSMVERNGVVVLSGGNEGIVSVAGTIDASGAGAGQTGGTVQVTGDKIGLFDGRINVAGDAGGGTVRFGGDFHGTNPDVQNASRVYVSAGSTINADALSNGDGGKVAVWSNDGTKFYGNISARGGAHGGDGGFVEVSGERYLDFRGRVDAGAPKGKPGTLLLDPDNITIDNSADANSTDTTGVFTATDNTMNATVTWASIDTELNTNNTNVEVKTTNSGNITVGAAGSITGGNTLFLNAQGVVNINFDITTTNATNLKFTGTSINLGANLTSAGGTITFNNPVALTASSTLSAGSGGINFTSTVNGGFALTANSTGATTFGNVVGGTTALTSLTTNAGGTTTLTGSVTTSGAQTY
ncbi:MAG: filamentous hemagglutinin N-terminal domain-containing protein, partial [Nitrospirae bacterium]